MCYSVPLEIAVSVISTLQLPVVYIYKKNIYFFKSNHSFDFLNYLGTQLIVFCLHLCRLKSISPPSGTLASAVTHL